MESYSVTAVLSAVDRSFSSTIRNASKTVDAFQSGTKTSLGNVGKTVEGIGSKLTKGVTLPLGLMAVAAAKTSMDFGAQMSRVQAISGATGKEMGALKNQAIKLGAKTAFSAKQAAEGMENLASAGMNSKQIMKAMPGVLNLAAVSGGDVAKAADNMSTSLNAFGLSAGKSGHVADVFAEAAAKTNAEASDMGDAMKYVAPQAHAAGLSLEETAAAIGVLSDAGIKGSTAGTTLAQALMRVQSPSAEAKKAMQQIGFSAYDANGKMKPLAKQVSELKGKLKGMTDEQKQNTLATIYGMEGGRAMNVLLQAQGGKLSSLTKALKNSKGSAADMAKIMQDNAASAVEQLGGAFESAAIAIGDKMAPTIRRVADLISDLIGKFLDASPAVQNFILVALGIAAAAGPILVVIGKMMQFTASTKTAMAALRAMNGEAKLTGGLLKALPWVVVAAGIALLVAGFVKLYKSSAQFRDFVNDIGSALRSIFGPAIEWAGNLLGEFADWFKKASTSMTDSQKAITAIVSGLSVLGATLAITHGGLGKLVAKLFSFGDAAKKPTAPVKGLGSSSLKLGASVGIAAAGIGTFIFAIAELAKSGDAGVVTLTAVTMSVAALAATFAALGPRLTAGAAGMVAFGVTVAAVGVGIGAAALGIAALIAAFTGLTTQVSAIVPTFTAVGTGFIAMMTIMLNGVISNAPLIAQAFIALGTAILTAINTLAPQVSQTFLLLLTTLVNTVVAATPLIANGFMQMLMTILNTILTYTPQIASSFMQILAALLNAIATYMPQIVAGFANILINFLNTLTSYVPQIAAAATNLLIAIMDAIGSNAPAIIAAFFAMVGQFGEAIVQQLPIVLQLMTALLTALVATVVSYSSSFLKIGGLLIQSLGAGLMGKKVDVVGKATDIMNEAGSNATKTGMSAFDSAGGNSAIKALQAIANKNGNARTTGGALASSAAGGITDKNGTLKNAGTANGTNAVGGLKSKSGQMKSTGSSLGSNAASGISSKTGDARSAGSRLGSSGSSGARGQHGSFNSAGSYLGQGLANGISSMAGSVMNTAASIANRAAAAIRSALKIHSPSRVTREIGYYVAAGMQVGMIKNAGMVADAATDLAMAAVPEVSDFNLRDVYSNMDSNFKGNTFSGAMQHELNLNNKTVIEVPVNLDGQEVARITAEPMESELAKRSQRTNRIYGRRS